MPEEKFLTYADMKGKLTEKEMADLRLGEKSFELSDISYYPPYQGLVDNAVRSLDMHFRVHGDELPRHIVRQWNHVPVEGRFILGYRGESTEIEGWLKIIRLQDTGERFDESLKRPPKDMISGRNMGDPLKIKSVSAGNNGISFYADNENTGDGWSIHCRRKVD